MAKLTPEKFIIKDGRELLIRSPEEDDWEKVRDFLEHVKIESKNTYQFPSQPVLTQEKAQARIRDFSVSSKKMIINAVYENRFIAQADFCPVHFIKDHPWLMHNCYFGMTVIKEFWQQGIARRLLEILEREAKKMGYLYIRAEVRESNERGVKLYKNFGFEITGSKPEYAFIDGQYHNDLLIMKRI